MFETEAVFIPEQITEYRYGALLEISDELSINSNVFSYCSAGLTLWKIS